MVYAQYVPYYGTPGPGTGYENGPDGHTPETDVSLDNSEQGIVDASAAILTLNATLLNGLVNDGTTDNATAIAAAAAALPDITGYFTDSDTHTYAPRGGGLITIPPGVYALSSMIHLKPRTRIVAHGVTVVLTAAGAGFDVPANQGGTFSADDVAIVGNMVIDGNSVGTTGLQLYATSFAQLDVTIVRCTSHGLRLTGAQWTTGRATLWQNGGYGLYLEPFNPTAGRVPTANNNRMKLFAQHNTLGGVYDDAGGANEFELTSQFHAGLVGVTMVNSCIAEQFIGGHFEANDTHFNIGPSCIGTKIIVPFFGASTVVRRFVVNSGQYTTVLDYSTNASTMAAGGAHIEQNSVAGDITVIAPDRHTAATVFVNETGTVTDPLLGRLANPSSLKVIENDIRQNATTLYHAPVFSSAANTAVATTKLDADTGARHAVSGQGDLSWGPGDGTFDSVLKRNAAAQFAVTGTVRPQADATYDLGVNGGTWRNIYARALIQPAVAQTLTVAGAVTINTPTTGYAEITLQANATSSVISGGQQHGAVLTITWIQDATGGRTYAWPTNCKFAGGVAPSDTTLSKRTSVTFHYDSTSTNWTEISRAVAVG
jgi:hypothetical protein